jgi:plastocyanin
MLAIVLGLAGCGGQGASGGEAANAPTPTPTASAAAAKPAGTKVAIKDFAYAPTRLTVARGAKVTWTNRDAANHTVTFDTGAQKDLGSQSKGAKRSFTFAKAGTFAYHCDFHPNMHGTVVVR